MLKKVNDDESNIIKYLLYKDIGIIKMDLIKNVEIIQYIDDIYNINEAIYKYEINHLNKNSYRDLFIRDFFIVKIRDL